MPAGAPRRRSRGRIEVLPSGALRVSVYAGLNPLGPVIDGYRRTVLYGHAPHWDELGVAAASAGLIFIGGYLLFKRLEPNFAKVL